jgi:hypothetical protein
MNTLSSPGAPSAGTRRPGRARAAYPSARVLEANRGQLLLRTEPLSGPSAALTSHTTVRTPACQASWLG